MEAAPQTISSLLLPLAGYHLILPQANVAEIVPLPEVTPMAGTPAWLKGIFNWRAEQVALVSFEALSAAPAASDPHCSSVAVLYGLEGFPGVAFYALELRAIPQPLRVAPDSLSAGPQVEANGLAKCDVVIGQARGIIPDLARLEALIRAQLERM